MQNIMTFDVESYGTRIAFRPYLASEDGADASLNEAVSYILNRLDRNGAKATFFVLGELAERRPDIVRLIATHGHEVGSHAHHHTPLREAPVETVRTELEASLKALRRAGAKEILGFRAPKFSINLDEEVIEEFARAGLSYDSSLLPTSVPSYGHGSAPPRPYRLRGEDTREFWELPLATIGVASLQVPLKPRFLGLPLSSLGIQHLNSTGVPGTILFHPWELVPPPSSLRVKVPTRLRVWRDYGIPCRRVFEGLLARFEFTGAWDWFQNCDLIDLAA